MSEGPLLRPEEVAGVLSGMGTGAPPAPPPGAAGGAVPYSLREPVAIPPSAEEAARKRIASISEAIQDAFRKELGDDLSIGVDGFQQQAASAALSAIPTPACVLSFTIAGRGGIALALAPGTAVALVERALGGAGALSDAAREPTLLELRVLGKLAAAATSLLAATLGVSIVPGEVGVARIPAGVATAGETVGVGLLRVRLGEAERGAVMLVPAGLLVRSSKEAEPAAIEAGAFAPALGRVKLEVRPVLRAGRVSFGDLVELAQGTVLRLDAPESAQLDLRIAGQTLFRGRVVRNREGSEFRVEWRRGRRASSAGRDRR